MQNIMRIRSAILMTAVAGVTLPVPAYSGTVNYAYDALGRLAATVDDQGPTQTDTAVYWFDAASNRQRVQVISSSTEIIPVFRFKTNGNRHFYTQSFMEGYNSSIMTAEGSAFKLYRNTVSGGWALYRCRVPGSDDYFVSIQANCENQTVEGTLGYAAPSQNSGNQALYRFYKPSTGDHFITAIYQEGVDGGYNYESQLGFVPL